MSFEVKCFSSTPVTFWGKTNPSVAKASSAMKNSSKQAEYYIKKK
jgi:hypothetical protein